METTTCVFDCQLLLLKTHPYLITPVVLNVTVNERDGERDGERERERERERKK